MAPDPRVTFWDRISDFLPPWNPPEVNPLMVHSSGRLLGRKGMPDEATGQRRWLNWLAAAVTAIGVMLLLTKIAWGEAPSRRLTPAAALTSQ
ncbi:MAG: hypothetical protein KY475_09255 [Planctomycetes bacterium]|nr:hypothetical protein [Planctomycetota bacterium]